MEKIENSIKNAIEKSFEILTELKRMVFQKKLN